MEDERRTDGNLAVTGQKKVIVIEAAERPQNVKLRVAAYIRVSSDSEDQLNSFAAQNQYYATLISSKKNWTMTDIYAGRQGHAPVPAALRLSERHGRKPGDHPGTGWGRPADIRPVPCRSQPPPDQNQPRSRQHSTAGVFCGMDAGCNQRHPHQ